MGAPENQTPSQEQVFPFPNLTDRFSPDSEEVRQEFEFKSQDVCFHSFKFTKGRLPQNPADERRALYIGSNSHTEGAGEARSFSLKFKKRRDLEV